MAGTIIHHKGLSKSFWAEAMNIACHIINRVHLRPGTNTTPYEIWKGVKPNLKYFCVFDSPCHILKDREYLGKFDSKSDNGVFLGYS